MDGADASRLQTDTKIKEKKEMEGEGKQGKDKIYPKIFNEEIMTEENKRRRQKREIEPRNTE